MTSLDAPPRQALRAGAARAALLAIAAFVAIASAGLAGPAGAQSPLEFSLPSDDSTPVLVMRQRPTELSAAAAQEVRIFANGRCELHRPAMMRGAGDHVWTISPGAVRALLAKALDAGLADIDVRAHRASLRDRAARAAAAGAVQHARLDDDTIEFEIAVDGYVSAGKTARRNVRRSVEWRGLRTDRLQHPGDVSVQRLGELRDELDQMSRSRAPLDARP